MRNGGNQQDEGVARGCPPSWTPSYTRFLSFLPLPQWLHSRLPSPVCLTKPGEREQENEGDLCIR
jgi:hypothetical protein